MTTDEMESRLVYLSRLVTGFDGRLTPDFRLMDPDPRRRAAMRTEYRDLHARWVEARRSTT
jgi:hypothetical protein